MLTATCHCGAVRVAVPHRPESLTDCNCSICRRYAVLWAYYRGDSVRIDAPSGATDEYIWGDKSQRFVRCGTCGCIVYWQKLDGSRVGVNARMFDPTELGCVPIEAFDGAAL